MKCTPTPRMLRLPWVDTSRVRCTRRSLRSSMSVFFVRTNLFSICRVTRAELRLIPNVFVWITCKDRNKGQSQMFMLRLVCIVMAKRLSMYSFFVLKLDRSEWTEDILMRKGLGDETERNKVMDKLMRCSILSQFFCVRSSKSPFKLPVFPGPLGHHVISSALMWIVYLFFPSILLDHRTNTYRCPSTNYHLYNGHYNVHNITYILMIGLIYANQQCGSRHEPHNSTTGNNVESDSDLRWRREEERRQSKVIQLFITTPFIRRSERWLVGKTLNLESTGTWHLKGKVQIKVRIIITTNEILLSVRSVGYNYYFRYWWRRETGHEREYHGKNKQDRMHLIVDKGHPSLIPAKWKAEFTMADQIIINIPRL